MRLWGTEQRRECLGDSSPCWVCWNPWLGSLRTMLCLLKVVCIIIGQKRIPLLYFHFKGKWLHSPVWAPKIVSSLNCWPFGLKAVPVSPSPVLSCRLVFRCWNVFSGWLLLRMVFVLFYISKLIGLLDCWADWPPTTAHSLPTQHWLYLWFLFVCFKVFFFLL